MTKEVQFQCLTVGQAPHRVKKRLYDIMEEAVCHQPSVVLLDDLDHAVPRFTDAQDEASGEGVLSARRAQGESCNASFTERHLAAMLVQP